jgi:hypothetical protein
LQKPRPAPWAVQGARRNTSTHERKRP